MFHFFGITQIRERILLPPNQIVFIICFNSFLPKASYHYEEPTLHVFNASATELAQAGRDWILHIGVKAGSALVDQYLALLAHEKMCVVMLPEQTGVGI